MKLTKAGSANKLLFLIKTAQSNKLTSYSQGVSNLLKLLPKATNQ
jgi:hypothetical protein